MKKISVGILLVILLVFFIGCSEEKITFDGTYKFVRDDGDLTYTMTLTKDGSYNFIMNFYDDEFVLSGTYDVVEGVSYIDGTERTGLYLLSRSTNKDGDEVISKSKIYSYDDLTISFWAAPDGKEEGDILKFEKQ